MFLFLPCSDGCGMGCEKGTDVLFRFDLRLCSALVSDFMYVPCDEL